MVIDFSTVAKKFGLNNVNTTKLEIKQFVYDFVSPAVVVNMTFGDSSGSPEAYVPEAAAVLRLNEGVVFNNFLALNASPMSTGIPDAVASLLTTLNNSPGLIDGEAVVLTWLNT